MTTGFIRSFSSRDGSGFIAPDDGTPDVYVHASEVERAGLSHVSAGDKVTYERHYDRLRDRIYATDLTMIDA